MNEDRTRAAIEFLDVLDEATPMPAMRIALDGQPIFTWEQGDKWLELVPEASGNLRYFAEFGRERRASKVPFIYPCLPEVVRKMIAAFSRRDD